MASQLHFRGLSRANLAGSTRLGCSSRVTVRFQCNRFRFELSPFLSGPHAHLLLDLRGNAGPLSGLVRRHAQVVLNGVAPHVFNKK